MNAPRLDSICIAAAVLVVAAPVLAAATVSPGLKAFQEGSAVPTDGVVIAGSRRVCFHRASPGATRYDVAEFQGTKCGTGTHDAAVLYPEAAKFGWTPVVNNLPAAAVFIGHYSSGEKTIPCKATDGAYVVTGYVIRGYCQIKDLSRADNKYKNVRPFSVIVPQNPDAA